ncbi:MAG: hypothetical protein HDR05_13440 [Lachnospiraceae bacterium]|nr:hypothetical protein [Lachnospiraceae bacterium]
MRQRHSIILWKKAEREDKNFEELAKEAYDVFNIFQNYPQELRPHYLTVKSLKDVKRFEWDYENFSSELKQGINREGATVFEELGYSISFFSSTDEDNSCGFQMRAGNKVEKFYNTFIVNLPLALNLYDEKTANMIRNMFEELVHIYHPFWGCISNKALSRKYGKYLEGNLPTTVHWVNYWSEDIISTIGREKIHRIMNETPVISFQNGILMIKDTALDLDKEDDIRYHGELEKQFLD